MRVGGATSNEVLRSAVEKEEQRFRERGTPLAEELFHLIGGADDNAGETRSEAGVFAEHVADGSCVDLDDAEAGCWIASLESLLTDRSVSSAARKWFKRRGIEG